MSKQRVNISKQLQNGQDTTVLRINEQFSNGQLRDKGILQPEEAAKQVPLQGTRAPFQKRLDKLGMVAWTCNPGTQK